MATSEQCRCGHHLDEHTGGLVGNCRQCDCKTFQALNVQARTFSGKGSVTIGGKKIPFDKLTMTFDDSTECKHCGHTKIAHDPNGRCDVRMATGGSRHQCRCTGYAPVYVCARCKHARQEHNTKGCFHEESRWRDNDGRSPHEVTVFCQCDGYVDAEEERKERDELRTLMEERRRQR